ncbi:MAG: flagellar biosynthesis anti-sigma factor FlgM [Desulforhopalus sp.]
MSIEFFGVGGPKQIGNLKPAHKADGADRKEGTGKDSVQFSTILDDVNKAKAAGQTADVERARRVQELKEQIKQGSYEPDLQKVSASLLKFLVEGR